MIIFPSFFLILLILVSAAWFIAPLYMFIIELCDDITSSLRWGTRFPLGSNIGFALALVPAFFISASAVLGISSELYFLWNPERRSAEPEKSRKVLIQIPEKVQVYTEFRLNDTVIGKEVL
jgi:hypothetical protein